MDTSIIQPWKNEEKTLRNTLLRARLEAKARYDGLTSKAFEDLTATNASALNAFKTHGDKEALIGARVANLLIYRINTEAALSMYSHELSDALAVYIADLVKVDIIYPKVVRKETEILTAALDKIREEKKDLIRYENNNNESLEYSNPEYKHGE